MENNTANVIAAGGDGTINEVASQLVNSQTNLGIIPLGSGNGFARAVGIPMESEKAINVLFQGHTRAFDAGKINDKYFFAVAGVGLDASIGRRFQEYHTRGPLPYFYLGIKSYFEYGYPGFKIVTNKTKMKVNPLLITIANAPQFGNNAFIAPQADMHDGLLDICILNKMNVIKSVAALVKLFNGKIQTVADYHSLKTDHAEIYTENNPLIYHIDGEPYITDDKIQIGIIKNAINVLTPGKV